MDPLSDRPAHKGYVPPREWQELFTWARQTVLSMKAEGRTGTVEVLVRAND